MALATKRDLGDILDKHFEVYTSKNSIRVDRDRAEIDPNYFMEAVLNFKQWPIHVLTQDFASENRRAVMHEPTFFGKTTQMSYGRTMYELCRDQDSNILVCSASFRRKLRPLMGQWKDTIYNNKKIQLMWPHMRVEDRPHRYTMDTQDGLIIQRSDKWFDEKVKSEEFDLSNPSFQIGPTGGEFQGIRFNIGITDDMLPGDTAISPAVRENVWHWYGQSFYSRRATDSWIWNIGTPHHKRDVCHKLISENGYAQLQVKGSNGKMRNLDGLDYMTLWPERKQYIEDSRPEVDGGMDFISFSRTVRCQPISDALQYFMRDVLEGCYHDDAPWGLAHMKELGLSHLPNICGVDLASGKKKTKGKRTETSYTCMMPWDGGRMTIPYLKCSNMSTPEKILTAAHILENLPNTLFVVEDNGMQADVVALYRSAEYIESCGVERKLACELAGRVKTITTTGQNKHDLVSGVQGMDGAFRGKRFALRRHVPEIKRLFDGFENYTADDHTDDPVMSTWFAWHYWKTQTPAEYKADNMIGAPLGEDKELHFGDGLTDYESECDPDTAGEWAGEMIYA